MRSPIIAFSLFAAVSPTLISAAPQSPRLDNDGVTHPRNTELKLPQRFAVPRGIDDVSNLFGAPTRDLPIGPGNSRQPSSNNGEPLPVGNTQSTTPQSTDPTSRVDQFLPSNTAEDTAAGTAADTASTVNQHEPPREPTPPNAVPRPPQPPNYMPNTPVTSDGNTQPNGNAHNGASPFTSRPLGQAPGKTDATPGDEDIVS
ncbi:hypothetical protein BD414DRAFT_479629 [Trametes punicea]|nr:hypothetical protein BD414DRAFT_479629 [Trametes punicea]